MKIILILICVLINIRGASAGLFPVVTSIEVTYTPAYTPPNNLGWAYQRFKAHVTSMEIGPIADKPFNPSRGDTMQLIVEGFAGQKQVYPFLAAPQKGTIGSSALAMMRGGNLITFVHPGNTSGYPSRCVGFYVTLADGSYNGYIVPCMGVPKPVVNCQLNSASIMLDHGIKNLNEVNNDEANSSVTIQCSAKSKAVLRLVSGEAFMHLTPQGKSSIFIDGKAVGSTFDLPAGETTLTVTDKLSEINAAGIYSGSNTLVMDMM